MPISRRRSVAGKAKKVLAARSPDAFVFRDEVRSAVRSYFAPIRAVIREIKGGSRQRHHRSGVRENA